jgi:hypothetical protein
MKIYLNEIAWGGVDFVFNMEMTLRIKNFGKFCEYIPYNGLSNTAL